MLTPIRPRDVTNQRCSAGSSTSSMGAITALADEVRQHHDRQLDGAVVHADDDDRPAVLERLADAVLVVDVQPRQRGLEVVRPGPGDLEVVAGRVAEGGSHEALEGVRVGGRAPDGGAAAVGGGEALAHAGEVRARLVAAGGRDPVPQLARGLGGRDQRGLGQPGDERRARP